MSEATELTVTASMFYTYTIHIQHLYGDARQKSIEAIKMLKYAYVSEEYGTTLTCTILIYREKSAEFVVGAGHR
jgi:hypothetical protein